MKLVNSLREYTQMLRQRKEDKIKNFEELNTYVTMMIGDTRDSCKIKNLMVVRTMDRVTSSEKLMLIKQVDNPDPLNSISDYPRSIPTFFDVLGKTVVDIRELTSTSVHDFREFFPYSNLKESKFIVKDTEILDKFDRKLKVL